VKSVLRVVLTIFLLVMLMVSIEGNHGILFGFSVSKAESSELLASASTPLNRVFVNQSFDNESVGATPANWTMLYRQYGSITVVNSTWYGSGAAGRSAMIIDGYTDNNPVPYRLFLQQNGTIGISFAIKPTSNIGVKKIIEVFVDDSNFNGACIAFKNGQIGYQDGSHVFSVLRNSYVPDRWYKIKLVLNVPQNTYRIYIDDHLVQTNVAFTGPCNQISRIEFNETSGQDGNLLPVAFIDEILGVQGVEIPADYGTIQEGINAANQGDLVFATKQRTYPESITIPNGKDGIRLYGEDVSTTIIDGSLVQTSNTNGISVHANSVRISGLTVRSTLYGTGIVVDGAYNTIENIIVINGFGDGIDVVGINNTITGSVIKTNLKCGVLITGANTTLTGNLIELNDQQGTLISNWNSDIEDNIIRSNLVCGIQISQGEQNFIRNNTIKKNGIGIECDAGAKNNLIYQNRFINNTLQASNADTTNTWDDFYPYAPDNETGGGNFWSDFNSADLYSGPSQDQPNPDGICDKPYSISPSGIDHYPLFLIQNVTQNPSISNMINYTTPVNVNATILNSVDISDAHLEVHLSLTVLNITMTITGNKLRGTIPILPYGTNVTYNVIVHADSAEVSVKSVNYGPYFVGDRVPPDIGTPVFYPPVPITRQNVTVSVNVTEPQNASGVNIVYVTFYYFNESFPIPMNTNGNHTYYRLLLPRDSDGIYNITITAVDNAGNQATTSVNETVATPELTVVYNNVNYTSSFVIDYGVLSPGQKLVDTNLTLRNAGLGLLFWNTSRTNVANWLKITPTDGNITSGNNTKMIIDVTAPSVAGSYETNFTITANGNITSLTIIFKFIVTQIVIDYSYASSSIPSRVDVNTTQLYGFHATWYNDSDALGGMIKVKGIGWISVDASGWANFNDTSSAPAKRTYYVEDVNFTYLTYHVSLFAQKASNITTIWDRVKITGGDCVPPRTTGGTTGEVWFTAAYEYDNTTFDGTNGILYLNTYEYNLTAQIWSLKNSSEPMKWSIANNRWEKSYSFNSVGSRGFNVSKVDDSLFNLTTLNNLPKLNTVDVYPGGTGTTSPMEVPLWAIVAIALTLCFGMAGTLIVLIKPTKKRVSKEDFKIREE
jgi:parallel beta-helix repeat protein